MKRLVSVLAFIALLLPVTAMAGTWDFSEYDVTNSSVGVINNPERGFYGAQSSYKLNLTPISTIAKNYKTGGGIIGNRRLMISWSDITNAGDIPQSELDMIADNLDALKAIGGMKIKLRFRYPRACTGCDVAEPSGAQIETHIQQLGDVIAPRLGVVDSIEVGFLGNFGEFHHSDNVNEASGDVYYPLAVNKNQVPAPPNCSCTYSKFNQNHIDCLYREVCEGDNFCSGTPVPDRVPCSTNQDCIGADTQWIARRVWAYMTAPATPLQRFLLLRHDRAFQQIPAWQTPPGTSDRYNYTLNSHTGVFNDGLFTGRGFGGSFNCYSCNFSTGTVREGTLATEDALNVLNARTKYAPMTGEASQYFSGGCSNWTCGNTGVDGAGYNGTDCAPDNDAGDDTWCQANAGGSTCINYYSCYEALKAASRVHLSSMKDGYQSNGTNPEWSTGDYTKNGMTSPGPQASVEAVNTWYNEGCLNIFKKRMGYRFVLEEFSTSADTVNKGDLLEVAFTIRNDGFGNMYNKRTVYIVLIKGSERYNIPLTTDPRKWDAGTSTTHREKIKIPEGASTATDWSIYLALPDEDPTLRSSAWGAPEGKTNTTASASADFSVQLANGSATSGPDTPFTVWDSTLGINKVGTVDITASAPTACTTNPDCSDGNTCTTDTCVTGGSWPALTGRIAISQDGNKHDCDDIFAASVMIGLMAKSGTSNQLVYHGYADHWWDSAGTCFDNVGAGRETILGTYTSTLATNWNTVLPPADDFNLSVFQNCCGDYNGLICGPGGNTNCQSCVDNLELAIEASSSGDPLYIVAAGPMDIVGRALDEANCDTPIAACQYVTVISHSNENDIHADNPYAPSESPWHTGWTWAEMQSAFPTVTFKHLPDQNGPLNTGGMPYSSWNGSGNSRLQAMYDAWVDSGKTWGDCSDAGMIYWLVNGMTTDETLTPQELLDAFATSPSNTCQYVNNSNSCDDGLYCNGTDTCQNGTCSQHTGNPCVAGQTCDESGDTCPSNAAINWKGTNVGQTLPKTSCNANNEQFTVVQDVVIGSESNKILIAAIGCEDDTNNCNADDVQVSFGAAAMTKIDGYTSYPTGNSWRASAGLFYYLDPPAGTTTDVSAYWPSGNVDQGHLSVFYLYNAHLNQPTGIGVNGTEPAVVPRSTTIQNTIYKPAAIVDVYVNNTPNGSTAGGSQTELSDIGCGATGSSNATSFRRVTSLGPHTNTWTPADTVNRDAHVMASFREAYGLPPTTTTVTSTTSTIPEPTTTTSTTTITLPVNCTGASIPQCNGICAPGYTCKSNGASCVCTQALPGTVDVCPSCATTPPTTLP